MAVGSCHRKVVCLFFYLQTGWIAFVLNRIEVSEHTSCSMVSMKNGNNYHHRCCPFREAGIACCSGRMGEKDGAVNKMMATPEYLIKIKNFIMIYRWTEQKHNGRGYGNLSKRTETYWPLIFIDTTPRGEGGICGLSRCGCLLAAYWRYTKMYWCQYLWHH